MRPPWPGLPALVVLLGGCALPGWVPGAGTPPVPHARGPAALEARTASPSLSAAREVAEPTAGTKPGIVIDRIVALVDGDIVTQGEVDEALLLLRLERRGPTPGQTAVARDVVERLIEARLQLQEAEREKIVAEDSEVDQELAERIRRSGAATREEFEARVLAEGLTIARLRDRLRESLRVGKTVRRKVGMRVTVTDDEAEQWVEANRSRLEAGLAYRARHLVVTPESDSAAGWEAARIRAAHLQEELARGGDFGELARAHSRDASARDGGDLGTLRRGELAADIEAVILALAPGAVSAPHRTPAGYHLFRLESRETLEGEARRRARQQGRDLLMRERLEARLAEWLRGLRERARIELRL